MYVHQLYCGLKMMSSSSTYSHAYGLWSKRPPFFVVGYWQTIFQRCCTNEVAALPVLASVSQYASHIMAACNWWLLRTTLLVAVSVLAVKPSVGSDCIDAVAVTSFIETFDSSLGACCESCSRNFCSVRCCCGVVNVDNRFTWMHWRSNMYEQSSHVHVVVSTVLLCAGTVSYTHLTLPTNREV